MSEVANVADFCLVTIDFSRPNVIFHNTRYVQMFI